MKITISELRSLIREELDRVIRRSAGLASGINATYSPAVHSTDLTVPDPEPITDTEEKREDNEQRER